MKTHYSNKYSFALKSQK